MHRTARFFAGNHSLPLFRFVVSSILFWCCCKGNACGQNRVYVQGYPETWSNVSGQPATFYLSGEDNPTAQITIYDHVNNRAMGTVTVPVSKQEVAQSNTEPWLNGYGWEPTTIDLPELPSGLYSLSGPDRNERTATFLVTEPEKQADIVVLFPTNTLNAYNNSPNLHDHPNWGEEVSLYSVGKDGRYPAAVSFHRPLVNNMYLSRNFDRMMLNERAGNFKYVSDADLEDYSSIAGAKMVIIPSHSEYWTENARRTFDKFVELGGSALLLSGNLMYRAIEYDDPAAPTQVKFRPRLQFTSPDLGYPIWESIGSDFLNGGFGPEFRNFRELINSPFDGYKLLDVSPAYFEGTELSEGDILHNSAREYDGVPFTEVDPETGPVVDNELLGFHRMDVIAFENTAVEGRHTAGTWTDFQKSSDSGRVIHVGEAHWTLFNGDAAAVRRQLTRNMIDVLLVTQADFNEDDALTATDLDLLMTERTHDQPRQRFDLTEDLLVTQDDIDRWLQDYADTWYGDADLDGMVAFSDFTALSQSFGSPGGWGDGDFNGDAAIDFADFLLLASNFSGSTDSGSAVPEPTTMSLLILALLSLCVCRRQRN